MTIEIVYGQVVVKSKRNELTFDYHRSWGVGIEIEHPSDYYTSRSSDGLTVSVEDWRAIVAHIDGQIATETGQGKNDG